MWLLDLCCKDISFYTSFRSCPPELFLGKGALNICSKFTGEHPCRRKHGCFQWNFIENTLRCGCSPINLLHIFRTSFYKNTYEGMFLEFVVPLNFFSTVMPCVLWKKCFKTSPNYKFIISTKASQCYHIKLSHIILAKCLNKFNFLIMLFSHFPFLNVPRFPLQMTSFKKLKISLEACFLNEFYDAIFVFTNNYQSW